MARRVTIFSDRDIRRLDIKKNTLSTTGIRPGTAIDARACTDDITNLGDELIARATLWLQNTAYVVGDCVRPPADSTVPTGHLHDAFRCNTAHTSTNVGTAAADWATDYALSRWTRMEAGIEGQPVDSQTIDANQKATEYFRDAVPTKTGTQDVKGYTKVHDRPVTDAIMDDLDEVLGPDVTPVGSQKIWLYDDYTAGMTLPIRRKYTSVQSETATLKFVGVVQE